MRLDHAWIIMWLMVLAGVGCSVRDRTGLKIANAKPHDAGSRTGACEASTACDADAGPVASQVLGNCHDGECWWSRAQGECRSAGLPAEADRPSLPSADDNSLPALYLGVTRLRIGETDSKGAADRNAWQQFGFDLDGVCTSVPGCPQTQTTCRQASMDTPYDGDLCRDNTFARLVPIAAAVPEIGKRFGISEETFNCNLWRGTYNLLLRISGYNGARDDAEVRVDFYLSPGLHRPPDWQCPNPDYAKHYPKWRVNTPWKIDPGNLSGPISEPGKLPDSMISDKTAFVRGGYLVARIPDKMLLRLAEDGSTYRGFALESTQNIWTGKLERDAANTWNIRDGIIAGRVGAAELIRSYRQIGLCPGIGLDGFYDGVVDWVEESVDVRGDGSVEPDSPCDAISFGFGYEASQFTPGAAEPSTPLVECCEPGITIADCTPHCGDGRKNGTEKCDTAIAEGMPGACPSSCTPRDACTRLKLVGEDCQRECAVMSEPRVGERDGCCPDGANANLDPDCASLCGNGLIEPGETCDPQASCQSCKVADKCLSVELKGSPQRCNVLCSFTPVAACVDGDGCCGASCTAKDDRDCSTTCGNGSVEANETCDGTGQQACPDSCDDHESCTTDLQTGSASQCNIVCTHIPVSSALSGDGCCPAGASRNSDADCKVVCGNSSVEEGEECDDGNQVSSDGCTADCRIESSTEMCLEKLGGDPQSQCARCTCEKCQELALTCYASAQSEDNALCSALVQCGRKRDCSSQSCYCGSTPLTSCILGTGNGPCKAEVEAAARTTLPGDIVTRSSDAMYPLGRANALAACVRQSCSSECEVQ